MNYILKGHGMSDDVISVVMLFYPNDNYVQTEEISSEGISIVNTLEGLVSKVYIYDNGIKVSEAVETAKDSDIKEIKRTIKLSLRNAIIKIVPIKLHWGILTGVRPAKVVWSMWNEGHNDEEVKRILSEEYLVSNEKIDLAIRVAKAEKNIIENSGKDKIGIYIGIPFCPTRCLYCSFTSYSLKQYGKKVDAYLDALEKEIEFSTRYLTNKEIESIYIGGGTPTSLNEQQLDRFLGFVDKYIKKTGEYTVEAGRPDTITREKLKIMKKHNVGRISINPQTLNDETLRVIGREHSTDMFLNAFDMARQEGHNNINTDIILGLPGEGVKEVEKTLKGIYGLNPESLTVHTLAVKRASRLKETLESYELTRLDSMESMLSLASEYAEAMDMHPYYMYRQKNMVGNFENVGYSKVGYECIYNVQIMEERQTILALGAGGSTKLVNSETNQIERIFNVKSVDDYINRIDEMIERKEVGMKWL